MILISIQSGVYHNNSCGLVELGRDGINSKRVGGKLRYKTLSLSLCIIL